MSEIVGHEHHHAVGADWRRNNVINSTKAAIRNNWRTNVAIFPNVRRRIIIPGFAHAVPHEEIAAHRINEIDSGSDAEIHWRIFHLSNGPVLAHLIDIVRAAAASEY